VTAAGRILGRDERGIMPVLEAILVALLCLAAILFVTQVQRPLAAHQEGGADLGDLAAQTVTLLSQQSIKDSTGNVHDPESWVNKTLSGDPVVGAALENVIRQMLPRGARYELSLTNGQGALRLAPMVDPGLPRNGRGAQVPFFANWTAFADEADATVDAQWARPGQDVTDGAHPVLADFVSAASTLQCIKSPNNATAGPSDTWRDVWVASSPNVPDGALYGVWAGYTDAACSAGAVYARVGLEDGTITDYPIYALRLVVWYGA
jgi:hypothetical protein